MSEIIVMESGRTVTLLNEPDPDRLGRFIEAIEQWKAEREYQRRPLCPDGHLPQIKEHDLGEEKRMVAGAESGSASWIEA